MAPTRRISLVAALALAGCGGPSPDRLDTDRRVVRGVLDLLVSDRKPVCVERLTYGDPLQVYRSARRGELQRHYDLGWGAPGPFRPPEMPTQDELSEAIVENRNAGLPDAPRPGPLLDRDKRALIDGLAYALSPSAVPTRATTLQQAWLPKGAHARWWPGRNAALGCRANYVISSIKRTEHVAFVAVRVDHWATLYVLARGRGDGPGRGRWVPVGQWASWLY